MSGTRVNASSTAVLCAAVLLGATACGSFSSSGPTSADAGKELQTDFRNAITSYTSAGHEKPAFTVSSDGSKDVACGKGKARRTYTAQQRATGKLITDPPFMNGEVQLMATFVELSGGKYQSDTHAENAQGPVTVSWAMLSPSHHTHADITGKAVSGAFILTLTGTTDCLPTP